MSFNLAGLVRYLQPSVDGLRAILTEELEGMGYTLITDGDNYIIGVPPTFEDPASPKICLVAHMDTIARKHVKLIFKGSKITNDDAVLGADDRAGVFAIMETVHNAKLKPFVIFTNYEESGGLGVKELVKSKEFDPYAKYIHLFIEPDRQDNRQYVWYSPTCPKEVHQFAQSYGFRPDNGSYSDVKDLTQAYRIPHVNLSVGYYSQHTANETLDILELDYTQKAIAKMITAHLPKIPMTETEAGRPYTSSGWSSTTNPTRAASATTSGSSTGTSTKATRGTYFSLEEYMDARKKAHKEEEAAKSGSSKSSSEEGTKAPSTGVTPGTELMIIKKDDENAALFSKPPNRWESSDWDQFMAGVESEVKRLEDEQETVIEFEAEGYGDLDAKDIEYKGKMYSAREFAKLKQEEITK